MDQHGPIELVRGKRGRCNSQKSGIAYRFHMAGRNRSRTPWKPASIGLLGSRYKIRLPSHYHLLSTEIISQSIEKCFEIKGLISLFMSAPN